MKSQFYSKSTLISALRLIMHAIIIGVVGGLAGVTYIGLVGLITNFVLLGHPSLIHHESIHSAPSLWGMGIMIIPILGGLPVVWLIKHLANNERGVSEPDVINFVHQHEGEKRYLIEIIKSLASAISIGTGTSVGGEIPIVQFGAALSYLFGLVSKIQAQHRIVLIAAGSAASLAAVLNAPLTGVTFAIEILLFSFNFSHIALIAISAVTGSFIGNLFFGTRTLFEIKTLPPENLLIYAKQLILYLPFAIIIGLGAVLLVKGIRWFKKIFEKNIPNPYLRHTIGLIPVGVMLYLMMIYFGHYYLDGLGYPTIQDILDFTLQNPWLLMLIFSCKIFALCLSLGSGASGGIFAPSLLLGAILGAVCGLTLQIFFPAMHINVIYFVLAGMAGMLSSVTGAMITSLVFIFEITKNYHIALPVLMTVLIGTFVRLYLLPRGIYTFKLYQHGLMFKR